MSNCCWMTVSEPKMNLTAWCGFSGAGPMAVNRPQRPGLCCPAWRARWSPEDWAQWHLLYPGTNIHVTYFIQFIYLFLLLLGKVLVIFSTKKQILKKACKKSKQWAENNMCTNSIKPELNHIKENYSAFHIGRGVFRRSCCIYLTDP